MKLDLDYLINISSPVLLGFARVEPRKWGIDGILLELLTEIGSLGRAITIWEGYRHGSKPKHKMGDELSDTFFVLAKLARDLKIELPRELELDDEFESPEETHFQLMQLAVELIKIKNNSPLPLKEIRKIIEEMLLLIGGIAAYYNLSLNQIHKEEMRIARFWQKMFFNSNGKATKHFNFLRKFIWFFELRRHERLVENM